MIAQWIATSDSLHTGHCLIFSVCSLSLTKYWFYESVMLSVCTKLSSIYVLSKERAAALMQGIVYLSKIENSCYFQELVSHPMPVCR